MTFRCLPFKSVIMDVHSRVHILPLSWLSIFEDAMFVTSPFGNLMTKLNNSRTEIEQIPRDFSLLLFQKEGKTCERSLETQRRLREQELQSRPIFPSSRMKWVKVFPSFFFILTSLRHENNKKHRAAWSLCVCVCVRKWSLAMRLQEFQDESDSRRGREDTDSTDLETRLLVTGLPSSVEYVASLPLDPNRLNNNGCLTLTR